MYTTKNIIAPRYIALKQSQSIVNQPLLSNLNASKMIYITDYMNTWSDFREIKYKIKNIDFHSVKHINKEIDTIEFFELFFTKYIKLINIDINSNFIFILKKLTNYEHILLYRKF